jgi:hypothetical protein
MENCESERGIRQKKEIHIHKEIDRQTIERGRPFERHKKRERLQKKSKGRQRD